MNDPNALAGRVEDTIVYNGLSENSKRDLLTKKVSFQGTDLTVQQLIGPDGDPAALIDLISMQDFIMKGKEIIVPSFNTPCFEKSLYIRRKLKTPFPADDVNFDKFLSELSEDLQCDWEFIEQDCNFSKQGKIEWDSGVFDFRQSEIWEKTKNILKKHSSWPVMQVSDDELHDRRIVMISGLAGSGKSTMLSHYYEAIKKSNPDVFIIRFNLVDHSDTILKFGFNCSKDRMSTAAEFFIDHLPTMFNNNAFALSLLKHRFESAGKIVVMLDGFDEIERKVQDKTLLLINAIILSKADRIYVTTEFTSQDKLQDKLFQFAYTLDTEISQEDQLNYMCAYWKNNSKGLSNEFPLKFANSLIDRADSLKTGKTFIGTMLQCRIMAECFQSNLRDGTLPAENLNIISLYQLFMDTKRRLFLSEFRKENADRIDENREKVFIKRIDSYLTKLAIETLFAQKTDVDLLWPHQSSEEDKTEVITEYALKFGLTFKTEEESSKAQFLHRTFAEYLFAKYLYEGFLLDDKKNNNLLSNELSRRLIVNKVMVEDSYDDVRAFLDCMLKDMVENEEWMIPSRLVKFAKEMVYPSIKQSDESSVFPTWKSKAFAIILHRKNENILTITCDCLGAVTMSHFWIYSPFFENFYDQSSTIFKRCLIYYYNVDPQMVSRILEKILYGKMGFNENISILADSHQQNLEERRKNFKLVLDFMGKHFKKWKSMQMNRLNLMFGHKEILRVFICNTHYEDFITQYLELLARLYSDDATSFVDLLDITLRDRSICAPDDRIEQILRTLEKLDQTKVVEGISRIVLKWHPRAFNEFYMPQIEQGSVLLPDLHLLLEKEPGRMSHLHRVAFHCNTERSFRQLLDHASACGIAEEVILDRMTLNTTEIEQQRENFYPIKCNEDADLGFTPFYVAATCGNEEVCRITLEFQKNKLSTAQQKDLTNKNGLLNIALWDAVQSANVKMFDLILKLTWKLFGEEFAISLLVSQIPHERFTKSAIDLLKSQIPDILARQQLKLTSIISACCNTTLINSIAENIGFKHLRDLLFHDKSTIQRLANVDVETLKGITAVNGCSDWLKRLLEIDLTEGFRILSKHLFRKLNSANHIEIIRTITSISDGTPNINYWAKWLEEDSQKLFVGNKAFTNCKLFLKCVLENLGEDTVKNMLLQDDGKMFTRILLLSDSDRIVDVALRYLSPENKYEFGKCVIDCAPKLIEELYLDPEQRPRLYWLNTLQLLLDYADANQLSKIVGVILTKYELNGKKTKSVWEFNLMYPGRYKIMTLDRLPSIPEKVEKFLKFTSAKLGEDTVKSFVLHNDIIPRVIFEDRQLVNVFFTCLSKQEDRDEVGKRAVHFIVVEMIEDIFSNPTADVHPDFPWMSLFFLELFVDYADSYQLSQYVKLISHIYYDVHGIKKSVWSTYLTKSYLVEHLDNFLKCVSKKLGKNAVKELLFNNEDLILNNAVMKSIKTSYWNFC